MTERTTARLSPLISPVYGLTDDKEKPPEQIGFVTDPSRPTLVFPDGSAVEVSVILEITEDLAQGRVVYFTHPELLITLLRYGIVEASVEEEKAMVESFRMHQPVPVRKLGSVGAEMRTSLKQTAQDARGYYSSVIEVPTSRILQVGV